jgi:hypothetical protein
METDFVSRRQVLPRFSVRYDLGKEYSHLSRCQSVEKQPEVVGSSRYTYICMSPNNFIFIFLRHVTFFVLLKSFFREKKMGHWHCHDTCYTVSLTPSVTKDREPARIPTCQVWPFLQRSFTIRSQLSTSVIISWTSPTSSWLMSVCPPWLKLSFQFFQFFFNIIHLLSFSSRKKSSLFCGKNKVST